MTEGRQREWRETRQIRQIPERHSLGPAALLPPPPSSFSSLLFGGGDMGDSCFPTGGDTPALPPALPPTLPPSSFCFAAGEVEEGREDEDEEGREEDNVNWSM